MCGAVKSDRREEFAHLCQVMGEITGADQKIEIPVRVHMLNQVLDFPHLILAMNVDIGADADLHGRLLYIKDAEPRR